MKLAIMQPYYFPYIGYFQLINAVDEFIIFDNAQYINRGWINRNKIIINEREKLFTFSVKKDNRDKPINERFFLILILMKKKNFYVCFIMFTLMPPILKVLCLLLKLVWIF